MSTIKAKALQLEADLAAGGTPNAFPSVPVTCNLEWDLLQQMHPYTLVCTVSLTDREHTWRNAVRQVSGVQKGTIAVEAMRDIVQNLGVPGRKISPTSHAGVLLMPSQALMRQINLSHGNTADVKVLTDAVQREVDAFKTIILDGALHLEPDLDNLLSLYESFHILNALPAKWSAEHLFKCNCTMCFQRASCQHVVLAGMVVDESIKMPIQYDGITLQSRRKRGRPAKKSSDVGAEEEGGSRIMAREQEGYKVPQVILYWGCS